MLRESDRKWIELERSRYGKKRSGEIRARDFRIRKKALKAIEDLVLLAKKLPEDQLNQIFNCEKILPLFKAILEASYMRKKTWIIEHEQDDDEPQRLRLITIYFHLWDFLKTRIPHLAPYPYGILTRAGSDRLPSPDIAEYALRIEAETLHSERKINLRSREIPISKKT